MMLPPSSAKDTLTPNTDFLVKDYELKITYLTEHFSRMWTRFNYFVSLQTAVVGGTIFLHDNKPGRVLPVVGTLLALVWYVMGAEDRYLVEVYRKQVAEAADLVARALWKDQSDSYRHVGEIDETSKGIPPRISGWRLQSLSTTKLAALIPLLLTFGWLGALIFRR